MQKIEIKPDTSIESLHKSGIVPDWMAKDYERHGMYEAENILCEWDWEDGWDLGDGYDKSQLEVLANIRELIRKAIGY